jgi:hypothetical protein
MAGCTCHPGYVRETISGGLHYEASLGETSRPYLKITNVKKCWRRSYRGRAKREVLNSKSSTANNCVLNQEFRRQQTDKEKLLVQNLCATFYSSVLLTRTSSLWQVCL